MGPFSIFVSYALRTTGERRKTPPIPIMAKSENEASDAAIAVADFLFLELASSVLVQVLGSDVSGHPIAEIRRPFSN